MDDKYGWKQARRELDRVLEETPDRLIELLETVGLDAALKKLKQAENPDRAWVANQARTLRVKSKTLLSAAGEMSRDLDEKAARCEELLALDQVRLAQVQALRLLLQEFQQSLAAREEQTRQLINNLSQLQKQEDLAELLSLEQLRKRIKKS